MPGVLLGATVQSETPPPPISGGTLLATADGSTVVAADSDRDQLHFVDAQGMRTLHSRTLTQGDEPGRLVEDAAGRIHVVLRGARSIATLTREPDSEITRREVCANPRGIAYDVANDRLHIACAEGALVTLDAVPTSLMPTRTLDLMTDIRDVLVRDDKLYVTRFRAAELLVVNADGEVLEKRVPQSFARDEERVTQEADGCRVSFETKLVHVESTPNVVWRAIDVPGAGVTMLHQRSRTDEIKVTPGGYGAGGCGQGIVQSAVTMGVESQRAYTSDLVDLTLAVDVATDAEGLLLAVAAPGNHGTGAQVQILQTATVRELGLDPTLDSSAMEFPVVSPGTTGFERCAFGSPLEEPLGQATAVTFVSPYVVAVQEREPAGVSFYDLRTYRLRTRIALGVESRFDTGHTMFHVRTGAGIACASCHPEGGDDGHVWSFETIGARRSQSLRGGLLGTEPLHWNGDMDDFDKLVKEVFLGRMSGFAPSSAQTDALSHWLDRQPALHAPAVDAAAAERGKTLFESEETRCAQCHAGDHLTNNKTENVGTGANLQVPSLKGVRFRAPLMHDGCASSLKERFTNPTCGGGDNHGKTSQLSVDQVNDLTAYLETL
jgi:cytochrome c553